MKRIFFLDLLLFVSATICFSCTKDESQDEPAVVGKYSINATVEPQGSGTRTALFGKGVLWLAGDKIMVVRKDNPASAEYRLSSKPGMITGTFTSNTSLGAGATSYALYPYSSTANCTNNVFHFTLPATQVYAGGSFANGANPMVAQSAADGTLQFRNVCGTIKFQLTGSETIGSIKLTTAGEKISGSASVDVAQYVGNPAYPELKMTDSSPNTGRELTLTGINVTLSSSPSAFYFVVPAQTYAKGLRFTVYDNAGKEITYKETLQPLTVVRAEVTNLKPKKLWFFPDETFRIYVLPILIPLPIIIPRLPNGDIDMDDPKNKEFVDAVKATTEIKLDRNSNLPGEVQTLRGIEYFTALTRLVCTDLNLKELDVSQNKELGYLECQNNLLTKLDLSQNTKLMSLNCINNHLSTLILNNPSMQNLSCFNNQLTTLDLSKNYKLERLFCYANRLEQLDITSLAALKSAVCGAHTTDGTTPRSMNLGLTQAQNNNTNIASSSYPGELNARIVKMPFYFPDAALRSILRKVYGLIEKNGDIDPNDPDYKIHFEIIDELNLDYDSTQTATLKIKTLAGIENFKNLTRLSFQNNEVTALDAHLNNKLRYLNGANNQLVYLSTANCFGLETLLCYNNLLTTLDIGSSGALKFLNCQHNRLSASLILSKHPQLEGLNCAENNLSQLDVSANPKLTDIYCQRNKISQIEGLGSLTQTIYLDCSENKLTSLPISSMSKLKYLKCTGNRDLANLDLHANSSLETLYCAFCNLSTLNIDNLAGIVHLSCSNNQLSNGSFVTDKVKLQTLDCSHNNLKQLDLTQNLIALNWVNISYNNMETLNIPVAQPKLEYLDISNNNFTHFNSGSGYPFRITSMPLLTTFFCDNNLICVVELTNVDHLTSLHCGNQRSPSDKWSPSLMGIKLPVPIKNSLEAKGEFNLPENKLVNLLD